MAITAVHSYLVHPTTRATAGPQIGGTRVALTGQLFDMLSEVYAKSDTECNIDISFNHSANGQQQNDVRDLLTAYVGGPTLDSGRAIAARLQVATTHRSGLGLLFLITGNLGQVKKAVVSRFPADNGILAEERRGGLTVAFLERIFMKSATAYKAALYSDTSLRTGFWDGRCVDKQVNSGVLTVSTYWIKDFLASDFRTTAAQGTRRVALALREAMRRAPDLAVKEEIAAAARLSAGLGGRVVSASSLAQRFQLSPPARELFEAQFKGPGTYAEQFNFDRDEFALHVAFASVELDNGGILTAEAGKFDEVFRREQRGDRVKYTTEGIVVDQKLRQSKK